MPNNLVKLMEFWDIIPKHIVENTDIIGSRVTNLTDFDQSKINKKLYAIERDQLEQLFPETCICTDCENIFPVKDVRCVQQTEWGCSYHESDHCPYCGSEDYYDLKITT